MGRDDSTLAFFMAHRSSLVSYASGIVGSRAQAEDVVQEAWLRFDDACRRRLLEEPLGYLYRIVRNLALDGRRRLAREDKVRESYAALTAEPDGSDRTTPESDALHRDQLRVVMAAIAELPQRTQIALEMHRFGGCKLREIADRLDISVALAHALVVEGIEHCPPAPPAAVAGDSPEKHRTQRVYPIARRSEWRARRWTTTPGGRRPDG